MWRLSLQDIAVRYGQKTVLDGVSAQFSGGEMAGVIGSNGVGKSTLLKAVAGLLPHTGSALLREDSGEVGTRRDIAYVPQLGAMNTRLTVFEMVLLGLIGSLGWRVTPEQAAQVEEVLEELGLSAIARQPFSTLSGGQRQLVTMAQSLIGRPKVLLLDEPTSSLRPAPPADRHEPGPGLHPQDRGYHLVCGPRSDPHQPVWGPHPAVARGEGAGF